MQKIRIDFDNPGLPQHISAVENDSQSRFFQATLYENGKAYTAPKGATYSIMYRGFGPQNQGWYDTINDGAGKRAACAVSGNVVTCEIARQALQVPGHVSIVLCVTTGKGYMLKSWPIECDCKNDRYDSTAEIQSFFYITQVSNADWTQAIQAWEDLKNTIDPTLSVSGKAADAAKVGEAVNAESERAKGVESQIKEDISYFNNTSGYILKPLYSIHKESIASGSFLNLGDAVVGHRYAMVYTPVFGNAVSIGVMDENSDLHDILDGQTYYSTLTASSDGTIRFITASNITNPVDILVYDTTNNNAIQDFIKKALLLATELKFNYKGRQSITIKSSTDEATNVVKLTGACNVGNIDVYFADAIYNFTKWYNYVYGMNNNNAFRCEIPIGNGCVYYFNGATINATVVDSFLHDAKIKTNCAVFGSRTNTGDYKLINGIINSTATVYSVHDEMSGLSKYSHEYENMIINYVSGNQENEIRKCIGGGAGRYGNIVLENCILNSDYSHELSFHGYGNVLGDVDGKITLNISDCYFGHGIQVDTLPSKEIGTVITVCNSFRRDYADYENKNWVKYSWNNVSRDS